MGEKYGGPEAQPLPTLKAEVGMPAQGAEILTDPALSQLHRARAASMLRAAEYLQSRGVRFSNFLEIGAGSAQRSMALLNLYGGDGVASDINQSSLGDHAHVRRLLGYERVPLLICCDAKNIPFLDNTFDFVFAYQMLHRFSDPAPVVAEAHRVLGRGGHFYFDEEPTTSGLREFLRRGRQLTQPPTYAQRLATRIGLHRVFWDEGGEDRSRWGIQVMRFDLDTWRRSLGPFMPNVVLEINRTLRLQTSLRRPSLVASLAGLIGGNTSGLCQKAAGSVPSGPLRQRLMCLDCRARLGPLLDGAQVRCPSCGREYPSGKGIIRMLPRKLEHEIYG